MSSRFALCVATKTVFILPSENNRTPPSGSLSVHPVMLFLILAIQCETLLQPFSCCTFVGFHSSKDKNRIDGSRPVWRQETVLLWEYNYGDTILAPLCHHNYTVWQDATRRFWISLRKTQKLNRLSIYYNLSLATSTTIPVLQKVSAITSILLSERAFFDT